MAELWSKRISYGFKENHKKLFVHLMNNIFEFIYK